MAAFRSEPETGPQSLVTWDFVQGFLGWRLWAFLGMQDIQQRYRRSVIGPFWLALGLGATVLGLGILYSQVFKTNSKDYIPYLSVGLLCWTLIATVINESTAIFQTASDVITSVKVPYTSFILRTIVRNLIVAAHSIIVVVIVFVWYKHSVDYVSIFAIPGLVLVCSNLYWISLLVGLISARFRDVAQIILYTVTIAFFLTPIIWVPTAVRLGSPYLKYNPFAQMVEVIRGPIFDHRVSPYSFIFVTLMLVIGMTITAFVFARSRRHLVYWI